jgi:CRISPR-associated protein Csb2
VLTFGIRYLNGFVTATEPDSYDRPEWPPHPARLFMALAAAHFQTGADPTERKALEWLEKLPAPSIQAGEAVARAPVTHFVPVNDKAGDRSKPPTAVIQSLPQLARDRQPRTFARAWLDDDTVYMSWPEALPPPDIRAALESLCAKVTRIGHSSSFVQVWLASAENGIKPNWVPDHERPEIQLRIPGPGTLEYLERCYNGETVDRWAELKVAAEDNGDQKARQAARRSLKEEFPEGEPAQLRPELRLYQGYGRPAARAVETAPGSMWNSYFLVRGLEPESSSYRVLDLLAAPRAIQGFREAILSNANDVPSSVKQILSGHDDEGAPLEGPHLAFVPLAFVGHPHADGHLLGMGLALPRAISHEDRRRALAVIGRVNRLLLGRLGTWRLEVVMDNRPAWNLRPEAWTAATEGATHWSTVTPVAFDRHPKTKNRAEYQCEVASMIAQACTRIGLPEPRDVIVTAVSAHLGVPPAHVFPRIQRKDGSERRHTHAILIFDRPVCGPMLLGAGRYRGYGVCRPLLGEGTTT